MNTQKKAFCYTDVADSYKAGIDYNKTQKSTVLALSNLKEKSTSEYIAKESKEDIEEKENNIFFKGCMCGMLVAFAIMLFIMNFIKEMIQ